MASRPRTAEPRSASRSVPPPVSAPAAALDLDRLIHERFRLGIVSALAGSPSLTFVELRDLLGATDGNLAVHARKLEEAGYVSCEKGFDGRVPRTVYRLTPDGRRALRRYLDHLSAVLAAARRSP